MSRKVALIAILCGMLVTFYIANAYSPLAVSFVSSATVAPGETADLKIILTSWWTETDVVFSLLSVPDGFTYTFTRNPVHVISYSADPTWKTETILRITVGGNVEDAIYLMLLVWNDQTGDPQKGVSGSATVKITVVSEDATAWPTKTVSITQTTTTRTSTSTSTSRTTSTATPTTTTMSMSTSTSMSTTTFVSTILSTFTSTIVSGTMSTVSTFTSTILSTFTSTVVSSETESTTRATVQTVVVAGNPVAEVLSSHPTMILMTIMWVALLLFVVFYRSD